MEKIIMYKAKDGKVFDGEQACLKHEEEITKNIERIWASMLTIEEVCSERLCIECPFYNPDEEGQTVCVLKQHNPCCWERSMINKEKL